MALEILKSKDEVKVKPLNDNFSYLEDRIEDTNLSLETTRSSVSTNLNSMKAFFEANISAQINSLHRDVNDSINTLNDFMNRIDKHINYAVPVGKIAIIDWEDMASKASVTVNDIPIFCHLYPCFGINS